MIKLTKNPILNNKVIKKIAKGLKKAKDKNQKAS
jgi:hypothetical protein